MPKSGKEGNREATATRPSRWGQHTDLASVEADARRPSSSRNRTVLKDSGLLRTRARFLSVTTALSHRKRFNSSRSSSELNPTQRVSSRTQRRTSFTIDECIRPSDEFISFCERRKSIRNSIGQPASCNFSKYMQHPLPRAMGRNGYLSNQTLPATRN